MKFFVEAYVASWIEMFMRELYILTLRRRGLCGLVD